MKKSKLKFIIFVVVDIFLLAFALFIIFRPSLHLGNSGVLNPQGFIAVQQRRLIITSALLMLIIVVPVLFAGFFIAYKYREGGHAAPDPNHALSPRWQLLWWAFPCAIIICLSVVLFNGAQNLDPFKAISSNVTPLTIQVVALQWKWLFIYPEQNIATVNFIEIPEKTPIHFELTADGPISSFWIPQLGGQMYAMAAMETQLNLVADSTGNYVGKDTEINGAGYAGMEFNVKSASAADFNSWVNSVKQTSPPLTGDDYNKLVQPSQSNRAAFYSSAPSGMYNNIVMKFMMPASPDGSQGGPPSPSPASSSATPAEMPGMDMKDMAP